MGVRAEVDYLIDQIISCSFRVQRSELSGHMARSLILIISTRMTSLFLRGKNSLGTLSLEESPKLGCLL
jgi:hypothetical protein